MTSLPVVVREVAGLLRVAAAETQGASSGADRQLHAALVAAVVALGTAGVPGVPPVPLGADGEILARPPARIADPDPPGARP